MAPTRKVYFNGQYIEESEARVSIFDSALMYGDMCFEMTRTYKHKPFRMRDHLERLYAGLKIAEIDCGLTIDEMEKATNDLINFNINCFAEDMDMQIMHNVSRGPLPIYESVFERGLEPTVTINTWPLITNMAGSADKYETGVHSVIVPQQSVPARILDPKIKNRSRMFYQIANLQAERLEPGAYPLLTDEDGFITEGTGNNFFIVKNGELFTPEGRNILRGVSRGTVIDIAKDLGIPCHETNLETYDVNAADEAFVTSTTVFAIPVTRFNFQPVGDGKVGPMVKSITDAFSENVGVDIVAQAKQYKNDLESFNKAK